MTNLEDSLEDKAENLSLIQLWRKSMKILKRLVFKILHTWWMLLGHHPLTYILDTLLRLKTDQ